MFVFRLALFVIFIGSWTVLAEVEPVEILRIIDGDTAKINMNGKDVSVRLAGIDAPEICQAYGQTSKAALEFYLKKPGVGLEIGSSSKVDKYDRPLGTFKIYNKNVNEELVRGGYAWAYRKYNPPQNIIEAEKEAKENKRGLWASLWPPVPPWEFRKQKHCSPKDYSTFSCFQKKTCYEMSSCAEARYHYEICGDQSLDGDKDGVPCETLCR